MASEAYFGSLVKNACQSRVPLNGSVELTRRCNLRCRHCYQSRSRAAGATAAEPTTGQWLGILDQLAAAGCLFLLVTGGEPLLRPDFAQIYRHARQAGLLVTVFTNATRVGPAHLELFREFPPHEIEVSLYGATAATYERITGVPGSYALCRRGLDRLLEAGLRVRLKTILMTENRHEFDRIEDFARRLGVRFRFDAAIFPSLEGDLAPLDLRVSAAEAVEKEFADPGRSQGWLDFYRRTRNFPAFEKLFNCVAGQTSFHVDAAGRLTPCLLLDTPSHSLLTGSFTEGWERVLPTLREQAAGAGHLCIHCEKRALCGLCPAISRLESGDARARSNYLCALGDQRWSRIQQLIGEENSHVVAATGS